MAQILPRIIRVETKSAAERKLFARFERELSSEFVVFHSVGWLAQGSDGSHFDGEADFIVAHPDLGLLVIEVKGGRIEYDGTMGQWATTDREGTRHILSRDPLSQAKDSRYKLYRKLKEAPATRQFSYPVYHAVCFPDVVADFDVRWDLPHEIILDQARLADLESGVRQVFQYWAPQASAGAPGPRGISALIELLAPVVELHSHMAADFENEAEQIKELTQQQFMVLDMLNRERRAIVFGCAGSGKTLLAIEKARRLAAEGFSVLFTCFNSRLADWLNATPYRREGLEIVHFHKLCADIAKKAKVTIPSLQSEAVQGDEDFYFDTILPEAMLKATKRTAPRYDALVVDEGQDFKSTWWIALDSLLAHPNSPIYIFCDDNQNIYAGQEKEYPFTSPALTLSRNCRNTQAIHALVKKYYKGTGAIHSQGPLGRTPEISPLPSAADLSPALRRRLYELVEMEGIPTKGIVILTPSRMELSQLQEGCRLGNFTLTWNPSKTAHEIECCTIHSFKGLERPVVILAELDRLTSSEKDRLAYIGVSRAKNHLIVIGELPAPAA